jgi:hypothetical protein
VGAETQMEKTKARQIRSSNRQTEPQQYPPAGVQPAGPDKTGPTAPSVAGSRTAVPSADRQNAKPAAQPARSVAPDRRKSPSPSELPQLHAARFAFLYLSHPLPWYPGGGSGWGPKTNCFSSCRSSQTIPQDHFYVKLPPKLAKAIIVIARLGLLLLV